MSHQRTTIRNALKDLLLGTAPTYATSAGARVFTNRTYNKKTLPAIVIYHEEESAIPRDIRSKQYIRAINFKIEITLEGSSDYDSDLDDICKEVENIMVENNNISGTATSSSYLNTELKFEQGEKTLAQATLIYEIKYIA